ncbi:MAG: YqgE/AlgH family protein [Parabacteroides sp.]|nr:YqgE/AlgH family protein [Parabacteroides sp.]
MDMSIFQIESNKLQPRQGSLLISVPYLRDFHFTQTVILLIEHNDEGSMGIVLNKNFSFLQTMNELFPSLKALPPIPLYKGGPVERNTLFYLHTLSYIKDAFPIGNGLYLNGDFNQMQEYILSGAPLQGVVRFFMGCSGWKGGQLEQEIEANTWIVNNESKLDLLSTYLRDFWREALEDLGGKYAVWSKYPKYPILN